MSPPSGKHDAILAAAAALFLKHGLRGTSMEAIARSASIAKPTLYAYFSDKQAVFMAIVEAMIAGWQDQFGAALGGEGGVARRVADALVARQKAAMQLSGTSPHAVELYGAQSPVAGAALRTFEAGLTEALASELAATGIIRPRLLAQLLLAAADGIGRKAQAPAELGPALRLLCERLIGPQLPRGAAGGRGRA